MNLQNQVLNSNIINTIYNISKNNQSITKVGVFGSYARGENTHNSDMDILYEYTNESDNLLDDLYSFACDIENELPRVLNNPNLQIDFVTIEGLNSGIMKDLNQLIIKNILNDVIWIYEIKLPEGRATS